MLDRRAVARKSSSTLRKTPVPKGKIRLVSQVTFSLNVEGAENDLFRTTVLRILKWIDKRAGGKLPQQAWDGKSFELTEIGSQRTAAELLSDPKCWSARLDDADKHVPQRTWVTEIGVGVDPHGRVLFGCRLICTTRGDDLPFTRTIPGFVKHIINASNAELDGRVIGPDPWIVSSEEDVASLVELLESPERSSDVVVFSLPEGSTDPRDSAASAFEVYSRVAGAAHICVLTGPASLVLSERVGHQLSVFRKGVRTYKPGFKGWIDQPSNHPLATAATVLSWGKDTASFESWLVNQILGDSVYGKTERLPSFNTIRQLAHQERLSNLKAAGGSDNELRQLFERDNEDLRKELKEQKELYDGLLDTAETERTDAIREASAAKQQAYARLRQIRALEAQLASGDRPKTPIPDDLHDFDSWCEEYLGSSVEMANRAFQGVRKSDYHDPKLIYQSLLLLRDYYVPMRINASSEQRAAYENELQRLKLEESFTGEGIHDDQYMVQYGGRRRALDKHLKGGSSRDRKFQFRLYFFWDDEDQVVVVGWLPSHLDNRMS